MFLEQRVYDCIERAGQYVIKLVKRQVDAVIRDTALWKIVGADALRTIAGTDLQFSRLGLFLDLFGLLAFEDPCLQKGKGPGLVLVL